MADIRLSQLSQASSVVRTDLIEISQDQGGQVYTNGSRKITYGDFSDSIYENTPRIFEANYNETNPTINENDGVKESDIAIDTDERSHIWRCVNSSSINTLWYPETDLLRSCGGTGLLSGGALAVNVASGSITFDVESGYGMISDSTNPENSIIQTVKWDRLANVTATFLTSDIRTSIFIDINGDIYQDSSPVTFEQTRDYIFLGRLLHSSNTISQAVTIPRVIYDTAFVADDLSQIFGSINIEGNVYGANGVNLNVNKTSGRSHRLGANYINSKKLPNITTENEAIATSFNYRYRDGLGNFTLSPLTTNVNPNNYDNGSGTLAVVPNKQWTIQRIYLFPGSSNSYLTYGQVVYASKSAALLEINSENPIVDPYLTTEASLRGWIIVQEGATNLSNIATCQFISAGKLGESQLGGSSGGDVVGPSTSTDNSIARFNGTTGKFIQDGANAILDDDGNMTLAGNLSVGSIINSVNTVSNTYSMVLSDYFIAANAASGAFTITLPAAINSTGRQFIIKKVDSTAKAVTIDGNSTETIDGEQTIQISDQNASMSIISDGTNWYII